MLSYLWRFFSPALTALRYFGYLGYRAFGFLSHIFPLSISYHPPQSGKPDDLEAASHPAGDDTSTSQCDTYTLQLHPQHDLEVIEDGSSSQAYKVNDHVVLKSPLLYVPPENNASERAHRHYASNTLSQNNQLQNERTVLQLLQKQPHPNIIEPIDIHYPEGIYLRKYHPLSEDKLPPQRQRIRWYRDLTHALCHIHSLGIVHADVQMDSISLDDHDRVILSDFGTDSPIGAPNEVSPINGPSRTLSEKTDMFAMGSLIYQMEHGVKPELSVDSHGMLVLPSIHTGRPMLDSIIQDAWLGGYGCTKEMLERIEAIDTIGDVSRYGSERQTISTRELRSQVREWREGREDRFGCVLDGVLSENQLKCLADRHGLDRGAGLRF
ncbi:kinase-like protein [Aspergillus neoniger CBS 115656]|uniref:Kinase-like protein n=1 Tax=Aspergillus neoniger (strain CBS 115656) TaxID=1448310 RepID=A0A318Z2Q7_ASPNB|nr:kinase-like protein [Aspergillus neoniger CBS 115656]PYH34448.1 kinase-like protein [Aspergillus neoniger CBS 115656]